ncbi:hypothetical protein ACFQ3N_15050 [Virgibacillus byunsanensis]|uniref:Uncharacterized protein n=1 Tax=Virgibacillus byunsanensis TaxID=570945 RepID=A0ABW3LQW5_9BACI
MNKWIKLLGVSFFSLGLLVSCESAEDQNPEEVELTDDDIQDQQVEPEVPAEMAEKSESFVDYLYNIDSEEKIDAAKNFIEEHVMSDAQELFLWATSMKSESEDQLSDIEAVNMTEISEEGQTMPVVKVEVTDANDEQDTIYVLFNEDEKIIFSIRKGEAEKESGEDEQFMDQNDLKELIETIEGEF